MIVVLTKQRHVEKIRHVCDEFGLNPWIQAIESGPMWFPIDPTPYKLGVSYCWPNLVSAEELAVPALGWYNYHPAPLPEWPGPRESQRAIEEGNVREWGVTLHRMNEKFDDGPIVKCVRYPLWEPPTSTVEVGAVAHWHLFNLFRDTIRELANESLSIQLPSTELRCPVKSKVSLYAT